MASAEKAFKWGIAIFAIFGILHALYMLNAIIALKIVLPILCVFLIGVILLQSGKGGGLAAIGGLGDQTAFGTRTSTFLTKVTYLIGAAFIVATILLFKLSMDTNIMNTKSIRETPVTQHDHDHPVHTGEEHKHAVPPSPASETDNTSKFGMQEVEKTK
ncbi:MAG: preprotein translocase subunit SecG [Candidatus Loosdrechtia sp.]|uniref:preprotein translocase subunit SecG n=1 Tax=Candidatus Loosdrechtia sp. TaxID=3101272 RepID=UPI003A6C2DF6|nr:MAG: preprotein translocase subunit SecG [Candidatus Jettenia sp. AMX2]